MKTRILHFKKALRAALFVLLLGAAGMTKVYAYDFSAVCETGQTLYYNIIDATNHRVELTCPGTVGWDGWEGYDEPSYNIVLPTTVWFSGTTYSVTKIGDYAFYGCDDMTGNLVIPSSVTSIGNRAFDGCYGFRGSLIIGNSVTTIGDYAFHWCHGFTGSLTIPNSVTSIGNYAFENCYDFTGSLTIGNSVTSIGNYAFDGCRGFTGSLTIPNSVTSIGGSAFWGCSGFTGSLAIPNSVTSIGGSAFWGCSGFTGSLAIPNSVTSIGSSAFWGCHFNGLYVDMTNIPNSAFSGNSGFTGSLTIGNSVITIGNSAFSGCSGFTGSLTIPNSVTSIGNSAFYNCSGFTDSLNIGNSVTSIGYSAFKNCSSFTEVNYNASNCVDADGYSPPFYGCSGTLAIGNNVERIPAYMFKNASFSGSLTIPNSVSSIGSSAFYNCSSFTEVHYNASNCEDTSSPFDGCSGTLTIGNNVERIPANMFSDAGFSGSLTIPNSVTTIGNSAFSGCSGFTGSLVIPNSVTSIGNSAFSGCSGFTGTLTIPNTVTSIGASVFSGCSGFTGSLTIPNSVTSIGNYAFSGCSGFTGTLTIPSSVTSISLFGAFYNCSGFTELHYNATNCADNSALSLNSTFEGCNCTLIIGDNVERIPACMFGYADFSGSLTIPNSVTSIGSRAFYGCSGFTGSLTIGNSVTSIGYYAFEDCSGFTGSLTIGNSVTSIGGSAFSGCSGFGSLTIPDVVTSIYDYAFSDCSGLASITVLANNPTVLGSNVFNNVDKTIPVYVPCASIITYQNTTGWNEFSNYLPETACDPGEITVTVNPTEGGSIAGAGYHEGGAICTVIATAHDGYAFLYWKDGGTIVSWDAAYSFIVSGDRDLEAVFAEGEVCNMVFDLYDSYGDGWTGNYLVVDYGNGSSEQLTLRSGSSVSYSRPVQTGSLVTLTWIEGTGPGGCSFDISFENGVPIYHGANLNSSFQYEFVLDCDAAYASYTISPVAAPEEGGTTEGAGIYVAGETCTLTAMPNRGYRFTEWTENGIQVSTEAIYSFVVNRDRNLEAVFSEMIQPFLELEVDAKYYPDSLDSNSPYVKVNWGCSLPDCEIVEDFETGDFSIYGWQTDSNYPWTITTYDPYEGNYCMKSGGAGVGSVVSNMTVMVYVPADGVMSFFSKISSENQWDYGYFYIDGVYKGSYTGTSTWFKNEFDITAGDHTFQWRYCKDYMVNMGDDCFYIDNITFYKQPEPPVQGVTYNFDDSSMQGWTSIDADGDGYGWMLSSDVMDTGYGYNGSTECVLSMSYNNDVGVLYPDNYLVSPQIQLGGVLIFYACAQDAGYSAEHFGVAVSMTNTNPSSFTMLNEWTINAKSAGEPTGKPVKGNRSRAQGNWYEYTVDLSAYSGMGFVAIRHFNCSDMFYLDIDDITIGEPVVPHSFDKYSVYRANCDGSEMQLIAGDVTGNQYLDTEWSEMVQGYYNYGVSIGNSPNADIFWSNCIEKPGEMEFMEITATANSNEGGTVTGSGTYLQGQICTLTAIPNHGYTFINWTRDGEQVSAEISYSFTVTESATYVANFSRNAFHFITTGTWSTASNWQGGALPGTNDIVFIDAPCQLDQNATVAALTVFNGQSLTLQSGKILTVTGNLTNTVATGLVIEDGAQLIHNVANVQATVKKLITPFNGTSDSWHLIALPLTGSINVASVTNLLESEYDLYGYDEATAYWRNQKHTESGFTELETTKGYLYANGEEVILGFSGTLENSSATITVPLSFTDGAHLSGFNLVGNPFPCNAYLNREYYVLTTDGTEINPEPIPATTPIPPCTAVFVKAVAVGETVVFTRVVQ